MSYVRMFLPPPEIAFARLFVMTFGAVTWYALNKIGCKCTIDIGFDQQKLAEYIEISCSACDNVDCYAAALWGMDSTSLTKIAWEIIEVAYDEKSQKLVLSAGGEGLPDVIDLLLVKPSRYFYGRGFSMEALRRESVRRLGRRRAYKPVPQQGYIDFELTKAEPYFKAVDELRRQLRTVVFGRVVHILLENLGDKGMGLSEAIDKLYIPSVDPDCLKYYCMTRGSEDVGRACINVKDPRSSLGLVLPAATLRVDLSLWVNQAIILRLIMMILEGSLELVSRWPSLAVIVYGAGAEPSKDETRSWNATYISPEKIFSSLHGVNAVAEELGVSAYNLVHSLHYFITCVNRVAGYDANAANALASRLLPLIDSCLRGFLDRDLFYSVVRMVESVSEAVPVCRAALRLLR